jgi:hypothetical protein
VLWFRPQIVKCIDLGISIDQSEELDSGCGGLSKGSGMRGDAHYSRCSDDDGE